MATVTISTDLTNQVQIDSFDDILLSTAGSVIVQNTEAFYMWTTYESFVHLHIDGVVRANYAILPSLAGAIHLVSTYSFSSGASVNSTIDVSTTGVVFAPGIAGIMAFASNTEISNSGSILAGIGIFGSGGSLTVENSGVVRFTDAGIYIDDYWSLFPPPIGAVIHNSGRICSMTDSSLGQVGDFGIIVRQDGVTVVNDGLIRSGLGVEIRGDHASVTNNGLIVSAEGSVGVWGASGIFVNSGIVKSLVGGGAGAETITNTGLIRAPQSVGVELVGTSSLLTNFGLIKGGYAGVSADSTSQSQIVNYGTIKGASESAVLGLSVTGASTCMVTIDNQGKLVGNIQIEQGSLANSGVVLGDVDLGLGGYLRNSGRIDGNVNFDGGGTFISSESGRVTGSVSGGFFGSCTFSGGKFRDIFFGGRWQDALTGSGGRDTLVGGQGSDDLTGGTGADTFIYTAATDSDSTTGVDRFADFEAGTDKIDLSAFLSGAAFVGGAGFSATGAEVRYDGATGLLSGDADGDGVADFAVLIVNNAAITAGDLIL